MKSKAMQQSRFLRIISSPIRALSKARNFYVKSITEYADRMNYCSVMAIPVSSHVSGLPRSFSARSYNDEELARTSSIRSFGSRVELDLYAEQQTKMRSGSGAGPRALRSSSVAMGRIDEDRPCCYFGEDESNFIKYTRSRSHAVSRRRF